MDNAPLFEIYKDYEDYADEFANMSVGAKKGNKLPHKAVLLLSVITLIESGRLTNNAIALDNQIVHAFREVWNEHVKDCKIPSVWIPFWYMKSEPFWHFKANESEDLLQGLMKFAGHPSVGQMRPVIKYAYLDTALYELLQNSKYRESFKKVLIDNYLTTNK